MTAANVQAVVITFLLAAYLVGTVIVLLGRSLLPKAKGFAAIFAFGCLMGAKSAYPTVAEKSTTRPVKFPYLDVEQRYLFDNGSIVSNDHVHVNFTPSVVLPSSAMIYLDYFPDVPDGDQIGPAVTYTNATLATFPRPLDFDFPNAVSNTWFCYTTWTPGPSVQTNGIVRIRWQRPTSGATNICAMLNTAIYTNDTKVVTHE